MGFVLESLSDQERDQENTRRRRRGGHDHGEEYLYNPKLGISQQLYYIRTLPPPQLLLGTIYYIMLLALLFCNGIPLLCAAS